MLSQQTCTEQHIVRNNQFDFSIYLQEQSLTLRLSLKISQTRYDVYETKLNSVKDILNLEEVFDGLKELAQYIKDPNQIDIKVGAKCIWIMQVSKLKKKKNYIGSIPLKFAKTVEMDKEKELIDEIREKCKNKKQIQGHDLIKILENIAICLTKSNKERKQLKLQQQQTKIRLIEVENNLKRHMKQVEEKFEQCEYLRKNKQLLSMNFIKESSKNYGIHSLEKSQGPTQQKQFANSMTKKISSIQKIIQYQQKRIQKIINSLSVLENINAKKVLPSIISALKLDNKFFQLNNFIQIFEKERQLTVYLQQGVNQLPQKLDQLAGLQRLIIHSNCQQNKLSLLSKDFGKLNCLKYLFFDGCISSLTYQQLEKVKKLSHLENLRIEKSSLTSLSNILEFPQLLTLTISKTNLKQLPQFSKLGKIKSMNVSQNKITELPTQIGKIFLEQLDVSDNPLSVLAIQDLLYNLRGGKLKKIYLRHLQLTQIPIGVFQLQWLQHLDLSSNQFIRVPKQIANLAHLKQVKLNECNNLLQIPPEIGKLNQLSKLQLSSQKLITLPIELDNLHQLQQLCIYMQGGLIILPDLTNLKTLKQITINNQQLTHIPSSICSLVQLTSISFRSNKINELPSQIGNLCNLSTLDLSDNKLTQIPHSLSCLPKAICIYFDQNPLLVLAKQFLKQMQKSGYQNLSY